MKIKINGHEVEGTAEEIYSLIQMIGGGRQRGEGTGSGQEAPDEEGTGKERNEEKRNDKERDRCRQSRSAPEGGMVPAEDSGRNGSISSDDRKQTEAGGRQ